MATIRSFGSGAGAGAGAGAGEINADKSSCSFGCLGYRDLTVSPVINSEIRILSKDRFGSSGFYLKIGENYYFLASFNIHELAKNCSTGVDLSRFNGVESFLTFRKPDVLSSNIAAIKLISTELILRGDVSKITKWGPTRDLSKLLLQICFVANEHLKPDEVLHLTGSKHFPLGLDITNKVSHIDLSAVLINDLKSSGSDKIVRPSLTIFTTDQVAQVALTVKKDIKEAKWNNALVVRSFLYGNTLGRDSGVFEPPGHVLLSPGVHVNPVYTIFSERASCDLFDFIYKIEGLPNEIKIKILLESVEQLLVILNDLHAAAFAHNDLKLENILVYNDPSKECGFSIRFTDNDHCLSIISPEFKLRPGRGRGTGQYVSFEKFNRRAAICYNKLDQNADIYAMGVIIYLLYSQIHPRFPQEIKNGIRDLIAHMTFSEIYKHNNCMNIMKKLFYKNNYPDEYVFFKELYNYAWCHKENGEIVQMSLTALSTRVRCDANLALKYFHHLVKKHVV